MSAAMCSAEGCELAPYSKGLCRHHYFGRPDVCSVEGCDRPHNSKGYCLMHYKRVRKFGTPDDGLHEDVPRFIQHIPQAPTCSVDGCDNKPLARGWCPMHYSRWLSSGEPGTAERKVRRPDGTGHITRQGYRQVYDREYGRPHGITMEHRVVMGRALGRRLEPHETVHHRNGDRLDNRLENLELRIGKHGPGQRVEDQVAWAAEILAKYGKLARRLRALQQKADLQLELLEGGRHAAS